MPATALAPLHSFPAHENPVNRVAFAGNGALMATSDTEVNVRVWQGRELLREYDLHSDDDRIRPIHRVHGLCFSPDGSRLYIAAGETVSCFNLRGGDDPEWMYVAPRLLAFLIIAAASLDVSSRGMIAASFENGTLAFWHPEGEQIAMIKHNAVPRRIAFLPDETLMGADPFSITRWSPDKRKPLSSTSVRDRIYNLAVSEDGRTMAIRHLWSTTVQRLDTGEVIGVHRHGRGLPLIAFAPTSSVLGVGSQHAIHLYNTASQEESNLSLQDAELVSLAFLPGGSQVVAGCSDGSVRTWDNPFSGIPDARER